MPIPGRATTSPTGPSPATSPVVSPLNSLGVNHLTAGVRSDGEDSADDAAGRGGDKTPAECRRCRKLIEDGQLVRALGGSYHMDCFRCLDCGEIVASKFFPFTDDEGNEHPSCEHDYFRRLNLICDSCKGPLRGSYITALGRKFHMDHFSCSACNTIFGPQDSYYEHDGRVYCHYHYSIRFAGKCAGCRYAIMKQFVEISKQGADEHWHPECYMINKFWNVRLANTLKDEENRDLPDDTHPQTTKRLKYEQEQMEEKVYQIWTALSAFEESSAACISEMLLHVSNGAYLDGVRMAGAFILHVEVLFASIDSLEEKLAEYSDNTGLIHTKEPKLLCKKIISFFTILSHTQDVGVPMVGVTQELLQLVTRLAHFLKNLIRIALTAALRLEHQYGDMRAIHDFLNKITELADQAQTAPMELDLEPTSDACQICHVTLEEPCVRSGFIRWHLSCLTCSKCQRPLRDCLDITRLLEADRSVWCQPCAEAEHQTVTDGFKRVTQLEQYTFLLRVAQQRLTGLLRMKGATLTAPIAPESQAAGQTGDDVDGSGNPLTALRRESVLDKRLSNTTYLARRQTLVKHQDEPAHHMLVDASSGGKVARRERSTARRGQRLPPGSDAAARLGDPTAAGALRREAHQYLSELSALQSFIVRHLAVLLMAPLVEEYYTLDELLELIDAQKNTFWSRFKTSLKQNKKAPREGTFGVPLEFLIERNGVDSTLGVSPGIVRVPEFIDQCITVLKGMDVTVEGIFRKNGNIRRLKEQITLINRNLASANLAGDNPIQLAALLKRFLRELPEPLLTFRLHRLFTVSQRIEDAERRKKVLHYTCCMLPEENRELMEVLFVFFKWVSSFAYVDEVTGNKMDMSNMATVITPNILYSKSKDPSKDDSFLANEAVHSLLHDHEEFALVPEEIADILQEDFVDGSTGLSTKDLLKKCESVVRLRRTTSRRRGQVEVVAVAHGDVSHAAAYPMASSPPPQSPPLADRMPLSSVDRV
ncbi:hypothetical protein THASP1DRAFT_13729 [Thamnocephalis sphaerospora]|uniref:RhoGAP-domain-containing protein n=1 Tax=Thamnocephalis sphaerospora TaxID=78915 RepID=A0A4P9XV16_9FUNG|nr:hypothetical protein THASP1DRAFT_13729 [Thamnocephalis sphaerospora]|eukprot:RKP09832.1 hypothetical protein THASP1DRAFT_13729 [Thamnocephalis sphaerospora]